MIVVVFTGGTISMRRDAGSGGAVPALSGREILELVPEVTRLANLEVDDWGAFAGPQMTTERMWALRNRIREHVSRPEVDGVVVTHGTDSLEETAYLIARSVATDVPIVFTGAMRTSSDLSWDGPANLAGAVRAAAAREARGRGPLVVICDRVLPALDVTKSNTQMLDAFDSPAAGPLAVVDDGVVVFSRPAGTKPLVLDPAELGAPVDILYTWTGADSRLLDAAREQARGLVLAGMGRGNVPPGMIEGIERWLAEGKPVVITSRVPRGRVGRTYGYPGSARRLAECGALLAGTLRPQQARIDLMLALGSGLRGEELRRVFEED